jgi:hypothetical protein
MGQSVTPKVAAVNHQDFHNRRFHRQPISGDSSEIQLAFAAFRGTVHPGDDIFEVNGSKGQACGPPKSIQRRTSKR